MMAVPLYYYTSSENWKCICELGLIWTSSGPAGDGVYLTEMPPMIGRLTIAEHLYEDPQDTYAMTEVCLETVSVAVPVEKLPGQPEENPWMVWMAKTHMGLSSFSHLYCAVSDTDWTETEVKSFIKKQHLSINPATESPISKLQEMAVQSGLEPIYSTKFVAKVCVGSLSDVGVGNTEEMAMSKAAKHLLRKLILRMSKNPAQMRPVHLDEKNNISVKVKADENERTLCNAIGNILITEKNQEISGSTGEVLTSNEALLNHTPMSGLPLKNRSVDSSSALGTIDPVVTLRELCMYNNLPLPIYEELPHLENEDQNTVTMFVKVGVVVIRVICWTKIMAENTAASIMLQKLSILNREEILGNESSCPNIPLLTADAFEEQGDCFKGLRFIKPVEWIQDFCANRGWPFPIYSDAVEERSPHGKVFVVHCSFNNFTVSGTDANKKFAKIIAAYKMWIALTRN